MGQHYGVSAPFEHPFDVVSGATAVARATFPTRGFEATSDPQGEAGEWMDPDDCHRVDLASAGHDRYDQQPRGESDGREEQREVQHTVDVR